MSFTYSWSFTTDYIYDRVIFYLKHSKKKFLPFQWSIAEYDLYLQLQIYPGYMLGGVIF